MPLVLHTWYARLWDSDTMTRDRITRAAAFASNSFTATKVPEEAVR